jgi:uncharacterized protein YdeI (YjbR/CyaY-like superfamily)
VTTGPHGYELVHLEDRAAWRRWLEEHHAGAKGVWLVSWRTSTGKPRLDYDAIVEEALCFGWIDTTVRRLDEDHYMQRFTPRSNVLNWSKLNLDRFDRMVSAGLMTDAGLAKRPHDVAPPATRHHVDDPIPPLIRRELEKHPVARRIFLALSPSYRRDYIRWITEAKKEETRIRRMKEAIRRLESNRQRVHDPSSIIPGK